MGLCPGCLPNAANASHTAVTSLQEFRTLSPSLQEDHHCEHQNSQISYENTAGISPISLCTGVPFLCVRLLVRKTRDLRPSTFNPKFFFFTLSLFLMLMSFLESLNHSSPNCLCNRSLIAKHGAAKSETLKLQLSRFPKCWLTRSVASSNLRHR